MENGKDFRALSIFLCAILVLSDIELRYRAETASVCCDKNKSTIGAVNDIFKHYAYYNHSESIYIYIPHKERSLSCDTPEVKTC